MAWGAYFGILLILEKLFLLKILDKLPNALGHLYTMFLVVISWALFAFGNFTDAFAYIQAMFGVHGNALYDTQSLYLLTSNAILFVILIFGSTDLPKRLVEKLAAKSRGISAAGALQVEQGGTLLFVGQQIVLVGVLLLSIAYMVDASYNPFLYFRF